MDTLICHICKKTKEMHQFTKSKVTYTGYTQPCKKCKALYVAIRNALEKCPKLVTMPMRKPTALVLCTKCHIPKSPEDFPADKRRKSGIATWCRECRKAYNAAATRTIPDHYEVSQSKVCTVCHIEKDIDQFHKKARSKDGKDYVCKICRKIMNDIYNKSHKEDISLNKKQYYLDNKGEIREKQTIYYNENKEELCLERKIDRKRINGIYSSWAKANPEKVRAKRQRKRARKKNAPINDLSSEQWQEILIAKNFRCEYCPDDCKACQNKTHKLTPDHVTPYFYNGSNTLWNIVPACIPCNASKNKGKPPKPAQPLLLTIALPHKKKKQ